MYSALLIVSSASAKGMQAVLTDDADRTTAFAWEGSYRTNPTIDQREICVQRRVRFASARLQTCKEISPPIPKLHPAQDGLPDHLHFLLGILLILLDGLFGAPGTNLPQKTLMKSVSNFLERDFQHRMYEEA
jgi:hypothetical protein